MPSESEFRTLLKNDAEGAAGTRPLDAAVIIRRSKRRRLPQQFAVGGLSTLAVVGIGFAGITAFRMLPQGATTMSAGSSAGGKAVPEQAAPGADQNIKRAPAERINLCGGEVAEVAPNPNGLVLRTQFPASSAAGTSAVNGTVMLTNTGTSTVRGTTAASPAITVSQDGVVLWHSNGPMIMLAVVVDLDPGQSMSYRASFTPIRCGVSDDLADGFPDTLPALPGGNYQLSAAIDFTLEGTDGTTVTELVTGPTQTVVLH
ncbi:MAG: hypothetical protein ABI053_05270 [Lacisediminihabitans sp.]